MIRIEYMVDGQGEWERLETKCHRVHDAKLILAHLRERYPNDVYRAVFVEE